MADGLTVKRFRRQWNSERSAGFESGFERDQLFGALDYRLYLSEARINGLELSTKGSLPRLRLS